jgi:hypothetical protein
MAFVWLHGRSNRDFRPFLTVFRSPRFYRLKNVPESRICSYRSENTHVSVYHTPRHAVRVYEIHLFFTPVRYSYRITDLVSSSATRTLISNFGPQPSHSSVSRNASRICRRICLFLFLFYFAILLGQKD